MKIQQLPQVESCKKETKNIVLLAMSTLNVKNKKDNNDNIIEAGLLDDNNRFTYEEMPDKDGKIYYSQLEPISRMIRTRESTLDYVVILATKETTEALDEKRIKQKYIYQNNMYTSKTDYDPEELVNISAVEFYKYRVGLAGDENKDKVKVEEYNEEDSKTLASSIYAIVRDIRDFWKNSKNDGYEIKLWVDTQGGLRAANLALNSVVSMLKKEGIIPEDIYYVDFRDKKPIKPIKSEKQTYKIFDFVSGMNEMFAYGRVDQLMDYYKNQGEIPELVKSAKQVSDAIQTCNVVAFETHLKELGEEWTKFNNSDKPQYLSIFTEQIKNDYGKLLETPSKLDTIAWLIKKKFYQQALTYIESRMNQWLQDERFLILHKEKNKVRINEKNITITPDDLFTEMSKQILGEAPFLSTTTLEKCNTHVEETIVSTDNILEGTIYKLDKKRNPIEIGNYKIMAQSCDIFLKMMYLYFVLKKERNLYNHMNEKDDKANIEQINEAISAFTELGMGLEQNYNNENYRCDLKDSITSKPVLQSKDKSKIVVNFTEIPSSKWDANQKKGALEYGEIIDLELPTIGETLSETKINSVAREYVTRILSMKPNAVICYGECYFTYKILSRLVPESKNLKFTILAPCYQKTKNEIKFADGKIGYKIISKFTKFRIY